MRAAVSAMIKLLTYYMAHAFVNSIKKLFKTWVIFFIITCFVVGVAFGLIFSVIIGGEDIPDDPDTGEIEVIPDDDIFDAESFYPAMELISGAVIAAMLLFAFYSADKSGAGFFNMADVDLLFPAPMKPQTVLLFKVLLQMGLTIVSTIYLLFQIPNLVINLGMPLGIVLLIFGVFILLSMLTKVITVCVYTAIATHERLRPYVKRITYLVLILIVGGLLVTNMVSGLGFYESALSLFNSEFSRYLPVWGWLKGIVMYTLEGNILGAVLCGLAVLVFAVILIVATWRMKADFYEDALASAEKRQDMINAAAENRRIGKARSEKLDRDGLKGEGANVFLYKSIYNRFRFSHFHFLSKTSETYLLLAVGTAFIIRFVSGSNSMLGLALLFMFLMFFKSFTDPISAELSQNYIYLVPEPASKKLFYALAAGEIDSLLDFTIPYIISVVIVMPESIAEAVAWYLTLLTFEMVSGILGAFIDLSLSASITPMIKSMLQLFFKMLIAVPYAVLIIAGTFVGLLPLFLILCCIFSVLISVVLFFCSVSLLERGRR